MERGEIKVKRIKEDDPYKELQSLGGKIEGKITPIQSTLDINLLGVVHHGRISPLVMDHILSADIVTAELPDISVRYYLDGRQTHVEKSLFWTQVIDFARENGKTVKGVNNDRDAADGIKSTLRGFNEYTKRGDKADISFSEPFEPVFSRDFETPSAPFAITLTHDQVYRIRRIDTTTNMPLFSSVDKDDKTIFVNQYAERNSNELFKAVIGGGDWTLLQDIVFQKGYEYFEDYLDVYPNMSYLVAYALNHCMRLRGDREQSRGLLNAINRNLDSGELENKREIKALHIGGVVHNRNLQFLLSKAFSSELVSIEGDIDDRIHSYPVDHLTFFSSYINPEEAFEAITVHEGEIFVNREKARKSIEKALEKAGKATISDFYKRETIFNNFENLTARGKDKSDRNMLEAYSVALLLEMVLIDDIDRIPEMSADLPFTLGEFIAENYPERKVEVEQIIEKLKRKDEYFEN